MSEEFLKVIEDYKTTVGQVLKLLSKKFGDINYVSAKNTEKVPKSGYLDDKEEIKYNLHGIGITVDFTDVSIVFDFDFQLNNHFGFNPWQLERFAKINAEKYPDLSKSPYGEIETEFQNALNDLEKKGKIIFDRTKNRYYLT